MAYQPQFVPPSSPVPSDAPTGYSQPQQQGYGQLHPGTAPSTQTSPTSFAPAPYAPAPSPYAPSPPALTPYVVQSTPRRHRPAVVGMSASMTVTASVLWACALATAWLFAAAGERRLAADQDFDGQVLILLNRFSARLLDGLAIPLFGLPMLAFVAAFMLLSGRRWAQVLYSLLGAVTIGWLIWWLHDSWVWAVAPIAYVVISVAVVWTPSAVRWFGRGNVP